MDSAENLITLLDSVLLALLDVVKETSNTSAIGVPGHLYLIKMYYVSQIDIYH